MRFKVYLRKFKKEYEEVIIADNKEESINIALKNNPYSKVIRAEWTFKS
mgnify:CR=1 FL=1|tara:strand:- start:2178 stop:2324 length:147 start_codon:yes stop_codon:yes gene_type:complete